MSLGVQVMKKTAQRVSQARVWPGSLVQGREIAATLHVEEDSKYVVAALEAIRRFHGRELARAVSGDKGARDIKTLSAFAQAMEGLNADVISCLARSRVALEVPPSPDVIAAVARLPAPDIAAIARRAANDLKLEQRTKPKPKRGPKRNESRDILFRELADIYEAATGKRAIIHRTSESLTKPGGRPSGPFFRLVQAAVTLLPNLAKLPEHTLASAVERATQTQK